MSIKDIGILLKDAGSEWMEDKAPRLGAALAYYSIFSLAPLLVIAIAIAGLLFGRDAAEGQIVAQIQSLVGDQAAQTIQAMVKSASDPGSGTIASILGVIMLVVGAAGLFGELKDSINTIWKVKPKSGRGIWGFIRDRFLSFSMVLGIAFLLLVSLVLSAVLAAMMQLLGSWQSGIVGQIINELVSLIVITLLFAMIYRFLPDAKISWKDVWLGAAITALLFEIGKYLIGLYLGQAGIASAYGAAGSLAVLLIWLYYSAQIFLFGAEITKVHANKYGKGIVPTPNAELVTAAERTNQGLAASDTKPTPPNATEAGKPDSARPRQPVST